MLCSFCGRNRGFCVLLTDAAGRPGRNACRVCIEQEFDKHGPEGTPDDERPWWRWCDENPDVVAYRNDGATLEQSSGCWRAGNGWTLPYPEGGFVPHDQALAEYDRAHPRQTEEGARE